VAIQNGKSREPGTTGHTRRRSGNQKRTIQRTRHHRAQKTKKWQLKTDNPENPAPQGTQDEEVAIKNEHSREQGTQDEEVAIKNGQSREPDTTGHTRRRKRN
jgi:hypothetical protein